MADNRQSMARRTFHHRGLKEAAIAAALDHTLSEPVDTLDMRRLAAKCEVNQRAFYRHFESQQELIEMAGERAFHLLNCAIAAASPRTIADMLKVYITFALHAPHRYDLMMGRFNLETNGKLRPSVQELVDIAVKIASKDASVAQGKSRSELRDTIVRRWAAVHGMIDLWRRGVLSGKDPLAVADYIMTATKQ